MANPNGNPQNLKTLSSKEARKNGAKGGRKSQQVQRKRKAMREQMEMLLSLPLKDTNIKAKFESLGIDTSEMNNQMALIFATYQKALKGDAQAMNIIRELVGERVQEFSVVTTVDPKVKELQDLLDE